MLNYKANSLLFTAEPFADESFIGYLLRLADLNEFESIFWLFELADLKIVKDENFNLFFDDRQNLARLARITDVPIPRLQTLLYEFDRPGNVHPSLLESKVNLCGNLLSRRFIRREKPRLCPACLRKANYLRRIWELAPATACPVHKCLLLDRCPSCQKTLSWQRKSISVCSCGCDWRLFRQVEISSVDLRVSKRIYHLCGLIKPPDLFEKSANDESLPAPLSALNMADLLKVLFFTVSFDTGVFDTEGYCLSSHYENALLHKQISQAAHVFDDFPFNFYDFLSNVQNQSHKIRSFPPPRKRRNFDFARRYNRELTDFRYLLADYLPKTQFNFLERALTEFIARNRIIILS